MQLKDVMIVVLLCCAATAVIMYLMRHFLFPDFSDVAVQLTSLLALVLDSNHGNPLALLIFSKVVCLGMLLHEMVHAMSPEAGNQTLKLVLLAFAVASIALSPFALATSLPQGKLRDVLLYGITAMILVVYALPRVIEACRGDDARVFGLFMRTTSPNYLDMYVGQDQRETFDNDTVSQVRHLYGGFFYKQRVYVTVKRSCNLAIRDESGNVYSCSCIRKGEHCVDYNSKQPAIVKVSW